MFLSNEEKITRISKRNIWISYCTQWGNIFKIKGFNNFVGHFGDISKVTIIFRIVFNISRKALCLYNVRGTKNFKENIRQ